MPVADKIAAGVVAVAIITAFGLHAAQLSPLVKSTGSATSQVFGTAEEG